MDFRGERIQGAFEPRYEDITQDGRLRIDAVPAGLDAIWRRVTVPSEVRTALVARGILPLLTRFEIEAAGGPFSPQSPIEVEGGYAVAHDADDAGNVARVFLDMDVELFAAKGTVYLPPPEDAGVRVLAGRIFAEHIFTRPFAPPEERKVRGLTLNGAPLPRGPRRGWKPPATVLEAPPGARALEADMSFDSTTIALGLVHTDSNQHVNSLAYPRLFEEAALRRIAKLGRPCAILARKLDIAFRRPSFAGEKLRVAMRVYEDAAGRLVVTGAFVGDEDADLSRARVFARMTFEA